MNRQLVHSDVKAYVRYLQTSRHQLFACVEGPTDRFFYGRVCDVASSGASISYQIVPAAELPKAAGGKPALLSFYLELKKRRKLLHDFEGKVTGIIFFLDKDVDDLLGKQIRSRHIVYTECFDLEGQAFKHGALQEAASAAAFVESRWLEPLRLTDSAGWRLSAAQRWKEWVELCLLCRVRDIQCVCNFGNASLVNRAILSPADPRKLKAHLTMLEQKSGASAADFVRAYEEVKEAVNRLYAKAQHDRIFKGKWYQTILEAEIRELSRATKTKVMVDNFGNRLLATLLQTLDFSRSWAEHFILPVRKLLERLEERRAA